MSTAKLILQDPVLNTSIECNLNSIFTCRDIATFIKSELNLTITPVLFCYFTHLMAMELSSRTVVDGTKVYLPDDLTIAEIVEGLEHKEPAVVYFQHGDVSDSDLFLFRTDRFARCGYNIQRLNSSHVLLGGGGLLGNEIAMNLATLGIGHLTIMDFGSVDWYNIYRQPLFAREDVYRPKTEVLSEKLGSWGNIRVWPVQIEVPCRSTLLTKDQLFRNIFDIDQLIQRCDIVVGAFDIVSARATLQIIARYRNKPFLHVGLVPGGGEVTLYDGGEEGCYCCPWEGMTFVDGGACTLAPLEAQKIVGGLAIRFIVDRLSNHHTNVNRVSYLCNSLQITTSSTGRNRRCSVCSNPRICESSIQEVAEFVYNWLFPDSGLE